MAGQVDRFLSNQGGTEQKGRRSVDHTRLQTMTILWDEISWKLFHYMVNCHQIKLSIDIPCYSNIWRSIFTAWTGLIPSWRSYYPFALVPDAILWTIDYVYLQLPGGNIPLGELKTLQCKQWRILYPITSVECAFSTARYVGSRDGWLFNWENLRATWFVARCTASEPYKWCLMHKQHPAS